MQGDITDELEDLLAEVVALAGSLRTLARQENEALSIAGHAVLRLLQERRALTVPQLARLRGISRQSMQVLVDRLADARRVEYVANPDHQRSELLTLTAMGGRRLQEADQQQAEWLAGLLPHVGERALRTTIRQLRQIHALLRAHSGLSPVAQRTASAPEIATPARPRKRPGRVRLRSKPGRLATASVAEPPAEVVSPHESGIAELPVELL